METFPEWLEEQLKQRHWRPADLARVVGVPDATLSRILNGNRNPGPEVALGIANALDEPPEKVFRLAGLLPPLPGGEDSQAIKDLLEVVRRLPPEDQQDVLDFARFRYQKRRSP